LLSISTQHCLICGFSGNPIWPGSIPDGWELEWENDDEE
jgi:hypothetical protein